MNTKVLQKLREHLVFDQLKRPLLIGPPPQRIICLVPSITELLYDLGLGDRVIGITKFCTHPKEWHSTKTKIGGTKTLNIKKIKELRPDLIIANKEENVKEQIEELTNQFRVYISDISNLQQALEMMMHIGQLTDTVSNTIKIINPIERQFNKLAKEAKKSKPKLAYLIWREPYMTIGKDTFIQDMLTRMGVQNVFAKEKRYPVITIEMLKKKNSAYLFLSSEPYPFKQKHITELEEQLPKTKIILVDGALFSWYGSRLLKAVPYFRKLKASL
jgi:ABC-type Fe3+-hydroxamate transport system substrate-binding protein